MSITKVKFIPYALGVASLILAAGCTDESYDLSDLDTTAQIEFNDLTIPLNLTPLEFQSLITLNDETVQIIDGQYVLIRSDRFSEEIEIQPIKAMPEPIGDIDDQRIPYVTGISVPVEEIDLQFTYQNNYDMDKYITKIVDGHVDMVMTVRFQLTDEYGSAVHYQLTDAKFRVPVGFDVEYVTPDGQTHELKNGERIAVFSGTKSADANGVCEYHFRATKLDAEAIINAGLGQIDYSDGFVKVDGSFDVMGGTVSVLGSNDNRVQFADLKVNLNLGELTINSFSGTVRYDLDEIAEQHVELTGLPKVLKDPSTRVSLINPQLYIQLNNPLCKLGFHGSAGMHIVQTRESGRLYSATLAKRLELLPIDGAQNFLICPEPDKVNQFYGEYQNPTKLSMPGLGQILMGDGLPQGLDLDFQVPRLEETTVVDFLLGHNYGKVEGSYTFYAPLAFGEGSQVVYEATQTGWDFGSDQQMEISQLKLSANVKSELPVEFMMEAAPIDEDGNPIAGVEFKVEPKVIPQNYDGPITITLTGKLDNLYGMHYMVKLLAEEDAAVLRPQQSLILDKVRVKISGKYVARDEDDEDDDEDYDYDNNYNY